MKKILCISIAVLMLAPAFALAQTTANGEIQAVSIFDITAPFTGVLAPFTLTTGDEVAADDVLFTLETQPIYAPASGTLTAVYAAAGDLAENVLAQYGSLAVIEKELPYTIQASRTGAYSDEDNKFVHVGEKIYFQLTTNKDDKGEGFVTNVTDNAYTIEVTEGRYEMGKQVKIYREAKCDSKSCIGTGAIARANEVFVSGTGRVLHSFKQAGDAVKKGELLMEVISPDAEQDVASADITCLGNGVISSINTISGQQVYKGQVLATLSDTAQFKVVAQVDEVDLNALKVNDNLKFTLDAYPDELLSGTITRISRVGVMKQNATYFDVDIAFTTALDVRIKMNATVQLP